MRHDLGKLHRDYLESAGVAEEDKDQPLFRSTVRKSRRQPGNAETSKAICALVKRGLKDAGLPKRLSSQSFRLAAVTDVLTQGVPLEDVQDIGGHSSPRMPRPYDRRQKEVTRNIVELIST